MIGSPFELAYEQADIYGKKLSGVEVGLSSSINMAIAAGIVANQVEKPGQSEHAAQQASFAAEHQKTKLEHGYLLLINHSLSLLPKDGRIPGYYGPAYALDTPADAYKLQGSLLWDYNSGTDRVHPFYSIGQKTTKGRLFPYRKAATSFCLASAIGSPRSLASAWKKRPYWDGRSNARAISVEHKTAAYQLYHQRSSSQDTDAQRLYAEMSDVYDAKIDRYVLMTGNSSSAIQQSQPVLPIRTSKGAWRKEQRFDNAGDYYHRNSITGDLEPHGKAHIFPGEIMREYDVFSTLARLAVRFGVSAEYKSALEDLDKEMKRNNPEDVPLSDWQEQDMQQREAERQKRAANLAKQSQIVAQPPHRLDLGR